MDVFRSVYILAEETEYAAWVEAFWKATLPAGDCLGALLTPEDLRGEVTAWGMWPHWTLLDALTLSEPVTFAEIVQAVCRLCPRPVIQPVGLAIFGGTSLVVRCESPGLEQVRAVLIGATRHLIGRVGLADEEFQKASWWIHKVGNNVEQNLQALKQVRALYHQAGSPPLPSSRHFRLGFLVRLYKEVERAPAEAKLHKERQLRYFLRYAEPPWYANAGSLHTTIASGLQGTRSLESFTALLWPTIQRKLGAYTPRHLTIMGEDPQNEIAVSCFDWLTETFVEEKRPGFQVIAQADFAGAG